MIFTCLFSLLVLASTVEGSLHLLEVRLLPLAGRDENKDFKEIHNIIDKAPGVTVLLAVKEVGNPHVYAVLDIADDLDFIEITKQLAARGDDYSSVPLYNCEDFASELNVNVSVTHDFQNEITHFSHLTFPVHGLSEAAYNSEVGDFLQNVNTKFSQSGWEMTCFREGIEIPYQMFFFTNEPSSADFDLATIMKAGEEFEVKHHLINTLETYVNGICA